MRNTCSIEIAAPIDRVYRWIDEPECVKQWLRHLVEYERPDRAESAEGTNIRQVWDDEAQRTEMTGRITIYSPPSELGLTLSGDRFRVQIYYTLKDLGGRTELTQQAHFRYAGLLGLIDLAAGRLLRKSYTEELQRNFATLTKLCEAEAGGR